MFLGDIRRHAITLTSTRSPCVVHSITENECDNPML